MFDLREKKCDKARLGDIVKGKFLYSSKMSAPWKTKQRQEKGKWEENKVNSSKWKERKDDSQKQWVIPEGNLEQKIKMATVQSGGKETWNRDCIILPVLNVWCDSALYLCKRRFFN